MRTTHADHSGSKLVCKDGEQMAASTVHSTPSEQTAHLLDELIRVSPTGIAVMRGKEFVFERVNQKFAELVGPREYVGLPFHRVYKELPGSPLLKLLADVYRTGKPHTESEMQIRVEIGRGVLEDRFYDFTYDRVGSEPYAIICHCANVTERVLARRQAMASRSALEVSQERLALAAAVAKVGFYDWDIVNDLVVYSEQMMRDWGIDHATALQAAIERIHPDDRANTAREIQKSMDTLKPFSTEYRLQHSDGRIAWIEAQGRVEVDASGKPARFFGTSIDVTGRKLEQEMLTSAIQSRDAFLGIASHELRTPLTALTLQTQLIQRRILKDGDAGFDKSRALRSIEQTTEQTRRLCRLVDDMLDASRIASGKLTVVLKRMPLSPLIDDVIGRFGTQLSDVGCVVTLDINNDVAAKLDPYRFEQVLVNLLTNIIKYAPGKPVEISLRCENSSARVSVRDHGPGIPTEMVGQVFERFERLGGGKNVSGLGLGLYISAEIVAAHGGQLKVESTPGCGCDFIILLPAEP